MDVFSKPIGLSTFNGLYQLSRLCDTSIVIVRFHGGVSKVYGIGES